MNGSVEIPHFTDGRGGVIVVGSVTVDVTTFSTRLPLRGETILGDDVTLVLGGKGANQAVAAARAGARVALVGCVGSDAFQSLVLDGLRAEGIELDHVRVMPGATGVAQIRVDASGENDIVIVPKATALLDFDHVSEAIHALAPTSSVMLTQLEIPLPTAMHAIQRARAAGLIVILDPAPAAMLPDEIWASIDIVTPNETEASAITGVTVTDAKSAAEAARWFLDRGTRTAVITLAAAGAVLVTTDGSTTFEAVRVEAIDTTAAGDAFAGYLGAALAAGDSLQASIIRAMAAGALAVTRRGASPSLPFTAEVDALVNRPAATAHSDLGQPAATH